MSKKRERESFESFEAAEQAMRERSTSPAPTLAKSAPKRSTWPSSIRRHAATALGLLGGIGLGAVVIYGLHVYTHKAKAGEWPPVQTFEDRWQMPCINLGNCPAHDGHAPQDKAKPGHLAPQGGGQPGHGGGAPAKQQPKKSSA